MMSYLTFYLTDRIQALQSQNPRRTILKIKPYFITFHEGISVSL